MGGVPPPFDPFDKLRAGRFRMYCGRDEDGVLIGKRTVGTSRNAD